MIEMGSKRNQLGVVPVFVIALLAILGLGGVTTVLANNSVPGDPLFALDQAVETLQISLAGSNEAKVKIRLAIAEERVEELTEIPSDSEFVDDALEEAQEAIDDVETEIEENHIQIEAASLEALLTQLQSLLVLYQGRISEIEIEVEDGEAKAELELFEVEATESAELVEDALEDLDEDGDLDDFGDEDDGDDEEEDNNDDELEDEGETGED